MIGFGRMHEEGGRSGRCEGGGELRADMTALADAGHDDAARYATDHVDRPSESFAQTVGKSFFQGDQTGLFCFDCAKRGGDRIIFNEFYSAFDHGRRLSVFPRRVHIRDQPDTFKDHYIR